MGRNTFEVPKKLLPNLPQDIATDPEALALCAFGFDAPCGGYFIQIFIDLNDELTEKYEEHPKFNGDVFSIEDIGFFPGVSKNVVIDCLVKYQLVDIAKQQHPKAFDNLLMDLPC